MPPQSGRRGAAWPSTRSAGRTLKQALEGPERQIILEVLESNHWNRHATAEALGINRTTLYKKMKRLGLEDGHSEAPPRRNFKHRADADGDRVGCHERKPL